MASSVLWFSSRGLGNCFRRMRGQQSIQSQQMSLLLHCLSAPPPHGLKIPPAGSSVTGHNLPLREEGVFPMFALILACYVAVQRAGSPLRFWTHSVWSRERLVDWRRGRLGNIITCAQGEVVWWRTVTLTQWNKHLLGAKYFRTLLPSVLEVCLNLIQILHK